MCGGQICFSERLLWGEHERRAGQRQDQLGGPGWEGNCREGRERNSQEQSKSRISKESIKAWPLTFKTDQTHPYIWGKMIFILNSHFNNKD